MKAAIGAAVLILLCLCWYGRAGAAEQWTERDVVFTAQTDGSSQHYVVLLRPGFNPNTVGDVLIALHGHGADRWQFVREPRDECRAVRDFALRHGITLVSPDYRAATSWMGPAAEADLLQIIEELRSTNRVGRIFLCGGSMGGTAALTFAALHPDRIAGVASMNGTANLLEFENFQDAIRESFGGDKSEIPLEYKKRSAEYWPERLTMPIGCTISDNDRSVPPDSVRRLIGLLQRLHRPVLLICRASGGHATSYDDAIRILEFVFRNAAHGPDRKETRDDDPPPSP